MPSPRREVNVVGIASSGAVPSCQDKLHRPLGLLEIGWRSSECRPLGNALRLRLGRGMKDAYTFGTTCSADRTGFTLHLSSKSSGLALRWDRFCSGTPRLSST